MEQIKKSDYRIGNIVKAIIDKDTDTTEIIGIVSQITFDGLYLSNVMNDFGVKFGYEYIHHIPLTFNFINKICIKYPFYKEHLEYGAGIKIGDIKGNEMEIGISVSDGVFKIYPSILDDEYCIGRDDIRYVHELQNIYYALTGEELEIKREWL